MTKGRARSSVWRMASLPGTSATPVRPALSFRMTMLRVKNGPCAPARFSSMLSWPATGMTCICTTVGVSPPTRLLSCGLIRRSSPRRQAACGMIGRPASTAARGFWPVAGPVLRSDSPTPASPEVGWVSFEGPVWVGSGPSSASCSMTRLRRQRSFGSCQPMASSTQSGSAGPWFSNSSRSSNPKRPITDATPRPAVFRQPDRRKQGSFGRLRPAPRFSL